MCIVNAIDDDRGWVRDGAAAFFLIEEDEGERKSELEKNVFSANDNDMNLLRLGLMALQWMDGWMDGKIEGEKKFYMK